MLRRLLLLFLTLPSISLFALPEVKLAVTELKGGSVMTDFPGAREILQPIKWFVINDQSSPLQLQDTGIIVTQNDGNYRYASRGIATTPSGIAEMELQFILFDVAGTRTQTLSRTEKIVLGPNASFMLDKLGPWRAPDDEVKKYGASVSFVSRVRNSDGAEWAADTKAIMHEVRALKPRLNH
jgi:hypothetical protein